MHAESTYVPYAPSSTREISVYRFYESKRCKMLRVNIYGWRRRIRGAWVRLGVVLRFYIEGGIDGRVLTEG